MCDCVQCVYMHRRVPRKQQRVSHKHTLQCSQAQAVLQKPMRLGNQSPGRGQSSIFPSICNRWERAVLEECPLPTDGWWHHLLEVRVKSADRRRGRGGIKQPLKQNLLWLLRKRVNTNDFFLFLFVKVNSKMSTSVCQSLLSRVRMDIEMDVER